MESPPVHGDTSRTGMPPGKSGRYVGTVIKYRDTDMVVQLKNNTIRVPLDASIPLGAKVQVTFSADGSVTVEAIDTAQAKAVAKDAQLSFLLELSNKAVRSDGTANPKTSVTLSGESYDTLFKKGIISSVLLGKVLAADTSQIPTNSSSSATPLTKYIIETPGQRFEAWSKASFNMGDFIHFSLTKENDRLMLMPADESKAVPEGLQKILSDGGQSYTPAYRLAQDYLAPFSNESWYGQGVLDFGRLLDDAGITRQPALQERPPGLAGLENSSLQWLSVPPGMVIRSELDNLVEQLLRMFSTNERDGELSKEQAYIWSRIVRNPFELLPFLNQFMPVDQPGGLTEASTDSSLRFLQSDLLLSMQQAGTEKLDTAIPERFSLSEFYQMLDRQEDHTRSEQNMKLQKFVLEAMQNELTQDRDVLSGESMYGYYWHKQKWRGIRFRFTADEQTGKNSSDERPVRFTVETLADNMGKVILDTALTKKGADIHMKHERGNRESIEAALPPELKKKEKRLDYLDFKVNNYTVSGIEESATPFPGFSSALFSLPTKNDDDSHIDIKV
ncbi:MAG: hypothetical protein HQK83_13425 [Fibrobacteria bacterium]|nr:hypothetical protein [Fibrobacteria bacterium]